MVLNPKQALGKNIEIHTEQQGFPDLKNSTIAIVGFLKSEMLSSQLQYTSLRILESRFTVFFQEIGVLKSVIWVIYPMVPVLKIPTSH